MQISDLPAVNAALNLAAGVFLTIGYVLIKRGRIWQHRAFMLAAFAASTLFLTSYVVYHANAGSVPFQRHGWIRGVYFAVLITHVLLAATVPPLAIVTLWRGLSA